MRFFKVGVACICLGLSAGDVWPQARQQPAAGGAASAFQPVFAWFERAHREYQDVVIKELSLPTGKSAPVTPGPPDAAPGLLPSLVDQFMTLLGIETATPPGTDEQQSAPSGNGKSGPDQAEIEAQIKRQIEARDEERRRASEEQRLAESARRALDTIDAGTKARQQAAAEQRMAAAEARIKQQPSTLPDRPVVQPPPSAAPQPPPVLAQTTVAAPPPNAERPRVSQQDLQLRPPPQEPASAGSAPPTVAMQESAGSSTASALGDGPVRWNRIPRGPAEPSPILVETAGRLARAAGNAAGKLLGVKRPSAKAVLAAQEKPAAFDGRSLRGCADAGRSVEPPATYTVKKGDSLWSIAKRHYERGRRYVTIVRANAGKIADHPDLIYPCQKVYLPKRHAWVAIDGEPS